MAVVKNKSTPENRAFWDHVEQIAAKVRLRLRMASGSSAGAHVFNYPAREEEGAPMTDLTPERIAMRYDFGEVTHPTARKERRCEYCYGPIPTKEQYVHFKGMWDGEWQNWKMHNECYESYMAGEPIDGFGPGDAEMPERVKLLVMAVHP